MNIARGKVSCAFREPSTIFIRHFIGRVQLTRPAAPISIGLRAALTRARFEFKDPQGPLDFLVSQF
jgi:hypothetical protein